MKYVISSGLFAVSFAAGIASAIMSYSGLNATFPTIPFVGFIGVIIAMSTITTSAAVGQARRQGQAGLMWAMLGLMALAIALDFGANTTATKGDVDQRGVQYQQALSAYTVAAETLSGVREDIDKAETDLAIVLGDDVAAAQLILVAAGQDIIIDGRRGPLTNAALAAYGRDLKAELRDLRAREDAAAQIVAAGLPEAQDSTEMYFAILLAAMLTLMSSGFSFAASILLGGDEIDLDELETQIDQGLANVVAIETWLEAEAA